MRRGIIRDAGVRLTRREALSTMINEVTMARPRWTLWLPATFAVVILSFLAATVVAQWQSFATDRAAREIAYSTAPSIEHLTSARGELRNLHILLRDELDRVARGQNADPSLANRSRQAIRREMDAYLQLPNGPAELMLASNVFRAQGQLGETISRFQEEVARGDIPAATTTLSLDFNTAATNFNAAVMDVIEFNAARAHDLALEIQQIRSKATYAAFGLDALATAIAIAGAVMLRRVIRDHADLVERHRRLEEERACELEQFAGRVAHDILSPLGAVSFSLQLMNQPDQSDAKRAQIAERGTSALSRVKRLVNGLLDFARAGATPDPDARADIRATLMDVASELQPLADERAIELAIKDDGACFAKCNAGVLTSLVANLAHNAIKYIGDGPAPAHRDPHPPQRAGRAGGGGGQRPGARARCRAAHLPALRAVEGLGGARNRPRPRDGEATGGGPRRARRRALHRRMRMHLLVRAARSGRQGGRLPGRPSAGLRSAAREHANGAEDGSRDGLGAKDERPERNREESSGDGGLDLAGGQPALRTDREGDRRTSQGRRRERAAESVDRARIEAETGLAVAGALERVGPVEHPLDRGRIGAATLPGGLLGDAPPAIQLVLHAVARGLHDRALRPRHDDSRRPELRRVANDVVDLVAFREPVDEDQVGACDHASRAKRSDAHARGVRLRLEDRRVGLGARVGIEGDEDVAGNEAPNAAEVPRGLFGKNALALREIGDRRAYGHASRFRSASNVHSPISGAASSSKPG